MALTSVTVAQSAGAMPSAPTFVHRVTAVGPTSYSAGGEAFDPLAVTGNSQATLLGVVARSVVTATGKPSLQSWEFDETNNLLVALTEARVEAAGDLSASTLIILVYTV